MLLVNYDTINEQIKNLSSNYTKKQDIVPFLVHTVFNPKNTVPNNGGCLMENSIHHSRIIFNHLKKLNLCQIYSHTTLKHIMAILISVVSFGFKGKTVNFERFSPCHRTTIAHFLNHGKWEDHKLADILKASVTEVIYREAERSGCPVLWMILSLPGQSLHHRLCIPLKMLISTSPI